MFNVKPSYPSNVINDIAKLDNQILVDSFPFDTFNRIRGNVVFHQHSGGSYALGQFAVERMRVGDAFLLIYDNSKHNYSFSVSCYSSIPPSS